MSSELDEVSEHEVEQAEELDEQEGEFPVVDFDDPVIDPGAPGFASLLPLIRAIQTDELPLSFLHDYVNQLRPRLNAAHEQVLNMLEQPFEQMGFQEEHLVQLRSAFAATQATIQELHQVLLLCESYLQDAQAPLLQEAEERLAAVQGELRQVLA